MLKDAGGSDRSGAHPSTICRDCSQREQTLLVARCLASGLAWCWCRWMSFGSLGCDQKVIGAKEWEALLLHRKPAFCYPAIN